MRANLVVAAHDTQCNKHARGQGELHFCFAVPVELFAVRFGAGEQYATYFPTAQEIELRIFQQH